MRWLVTAVEKPRGNRAPGGVGPLPGLLHYFINIVIDMYPTLLLVRCTRSLWAWVWARPRPRDRFPRR
jgi:hypothetical protein